MLIEISRRDAGYLLRVLQKERRCLYETSDILLANIPDGTVILNRIIRIMMLHLRLDQVKDGTDDSPKLR